MSEPTAMDKVQAALRDPEVQRLVRQDPELSEYADLLPPADEFAELAKVSPAAAIGRQIMNNNLNFEDTMDLLNRLGLKPQESEQAIADYFKLNNQRPDHPDFDRLSRIIRDCDALAETGTEERSGMHMVFLQTGVDFNTVAYMAKQRALRAEELISEDDDGNPIPERERLILMWLDAFVAGALFAQETAPTIQQLLDSSIDGSHRGKGRG
jgi:hypothetical protein